MSDKWYFSHAGAEGQGPITLQELQEKCTFGDLISTDLVWREGMPQWVQAGSVAELVFVPGQGEVRSMASPAYPVQSVQAPRVAAISYSQPHPNGPLMCTDRTIDLLRQTRPWARVIAVLIFILAGLMVLGGFGMMAGAAFGGRPGIASLAGFVYFAIAGLYIAPAIYLNRYCSRITQVITLRRDHVLEQAIEAQKSFWKFCGIFTLAAIAFYFVILLVIMILAVRR